MNPGYYNGYNNNGGYNNGYYNNPNGYGNRMMPPQGMPNRPNVPMNNNMNRNGNNQNPNNRQVRPVKPIKNNNNKGNPLLPLIIAAGVLGGIVLLLIILIFAGVFAKKEEPKPKPEPTPVSEGQVVGTTEHGFITIPNDWVDFVDTNYQDETTKQYSSQDTTYIVTVGYYNDEKTTSRNAAAKLAQNLKNSNCTDLKASDKKKIGEYATYQVSGIYPDGTMLMAFFFETEDGITRTIMVEGPDGNNNAFNIPYSFKMNGTPTNATEGNTINGSSTLTGDDLGLSNNSGVTKSDENLEELDQQLRSLLGSLIDNLT
jgi:hypothetical protein